MSASVTTCSECNRAINVKDRDQAGRCVGCADLGKGPKPNPTAKPAPLAVEGETD